MTDDNDPQHVEERQNQKDPWVMYLVVRESLGMGRGKISAQVGHCVGSMYEKYIELLTTTREYPQDQSAASQKDSFDLWARDLYRKIALGADEKEWTKVREAHSEFVVIDAGHTEVEPGSETVIGLWPRQKSTAPKVIKRLRLLK